MTHSEYEIMMVKLAGGCPSANRALQTAPAPVSAPVAKPSPFVVQNEDSFRESFMESLFKRGAAVRMVG